MKDFSAFRDKRWFKSWAHKICSWEYLTLKTCPASSPRARSASFLLSTLNSFRGLLEVSSFSSTWSDPCPGRWQVLMTSANLWLTVAWIKTAPKSWLIPLLLIPPQKEQPEQNHFPWVCRRLLQRELSPSKRCLPLSSWPAASWEMSSFTVCYCFLFNFIYLFWLRLVFVAARAFSPIVLVNRRLFSSCSAWTSHCSGFSCRSSQALGHMGFSHCGFWALRTQTE